jgi:hypothetical protein
MLGTKPTKSAISRLPLGLIFETTRATIQLHEYREGASILPPTPLPPTIDDNTPTQPFIILTSHVSRA